MAQAKETEKNDALEDSFAPQEFYRSTAVGTALVTTLNKFLASQRISAEDASNVLVKYLLIFNIHIFISLFFLVFVTCKDNFDRQIQASIREHAVMRKDVVFNKAEVKKFTSMRLSCSDLTLLSFRQCWLIITTLWSYGSSM